MFKPVTRSAEYSCSYLQPKHLPKTMQVAGAILVILGAILLFYSQNGCMITGWSFISLGTAIIISSIFTQIVNPLLPKPTSPPEISLGPLYSENSVKGKKLIDISKTIFEGYSETQDLSLTPMELNPDNVLQYFKASDDKGISWEYKQQTLFACRLVTNHVFTNTDYAKSFRKKLKLIVFDTLTYKNIHQYIDIPRGCFVEGTYDDYPYHATCIAGSVYVVVYDGFFEGSCQLYINGRYHGNPIQREESEPPNLPTSDEVRASFMEEFGAFFNSGL